MKLYFSPGACSLSPHIVLKELGLPFEAVRVDLQSKQTADGRDFRSVNPKGYVPTLELDDGSILTEGPAIVQYLADRKPEAGLAPAAGTMPRYRLIETLNFISTELHKTIGSLFNPAMPDDFKASTKLRINDRLGELSRQLGEQEYLCGNAFGVADAYAFTVLGWLRMFKMDVAAWPNLVAYVQRIAARPAVKQAMFAEGLIKAV
jgi:glutathione S-transferase